MWLKMKKILINVLLILSFLVIFILQINIFSKMKVYGIMPNLLIIYILFIGLYLSKIAGITYGILFGILLDLFIGRKVGISAIMLGIVGLIGGILDKNFSKENKLTIMIMACITTIIYEFGIYFIGFFIYRYQIEIGNFIKILIIESLYNALLIIILYPLMQNLGHKIEEEYKGNKILTRYF